MNDSQDSQARLGIIRIKRNQHTGWPISLLKVLDRHFQEMFDAILVRAFQRLHRAKERENLFYGEQGGFVIGFRHCDVCLSSPC